MKVKDSQAGKLFYGNDDYVEFSDGSPPIHKDAVLPLAQQIHDLLVGKGFTYMQTWLILHLVQDTLRQERDMKAL